MPARRTRTQAARHRLLHAVQLAIACTLVALLITLLHHDDLRQAFVPSQAVGIASWFTIMGARRLLPPGDPAALVHASRGFGIVVVG